MKKPIPIDEHGNPIPAKYDPADFVVAPSDTRGISYRLTFRVAPDLVRAIDQIIASNRFPLTSRGDVLRFFTREGIRLIEQLEPVVSVSKRVDLISAVMAEEQGYSDFVHVFDQLQQTVNQYMSANAPEQALRVVALAKHHFEMMPEGYWRDRYLDEIGKKFPKLTNTKGILITGSGSDE